MAVSDVKNRLRSTLVVGPKVDKVSGRGLCIPRSQNRDLHPTNQDLFVGTPDLGHPPDEDS
jgi:hypothetical protein